MSPVELPTDAITRSPNPGCALLNDLRVTPSWFYTSVLYIKQHAQPYGAGCGSNGTRIALLRVLQHAKKTQTSMIAITLRLGDPWPSSSVHEDSPLRQMELDA